MINVTNVRASNGKNRIGKIAASTNKKPITKGFI